MPLSKSTKSAIALRSSTTSDSGLLRSLSKETMLSASDIFRSRCVDWLVNELSLSPCGDRKQELQGHVSVRRALCNQHVHDHLICNKVHLPPAQWLRECHLWSQIDHHGKQMKCKIKAKQGPGMLRAELSF